MEHYKFKGAGFNVKLLLIVISILFLVSYGIFNAREVLFGPTIEIFSPTTTEGETRENTITIKGRAKNVVFLSINERPIFIDTEGLFEEKLLLTPWFNIIEIKGRDRFKNEVQKTIKIYYKQSTTTIE